ncbi:hypothetical protein, partial [Pseudomonas sp. Pseusp97]|uniref:hypothetical protein n=1 Tax=Pseudomonas sp. Pseusp97 TaxID=3243065 RepID=UPI0039A56DDB
GVLADIGLPVGRTFAGRAYEESGLLRFAAAFEATGSKRLVPPSTPPVGCSVRRVTQDRIPRSEGAGIFYGPEWVGDAFSMSRCIV